MGTKLRPDQQAQPRASELIAELLSRGDDEALRARVYNATRRCGASETMVEDAFGEACKRGVHRGFDADSYSSAEAWLQSTTLNRVLDELRHRGHEQLVGSDIDRLERATPPAGVGVDSELIERERQLELIAIAGGALAQLDERKRNLYALHSLGHKQPHIARQLGERPRVVRRQMERIWELTRTHTIKTCGGGCPDGERLVSRHAFGLALSQAEQAQAQLHLTSCGQCGELYRRLQDIHQLVAVLAPIPAAAQADPHLPERLLHKAGDVLAGAKQHASDTGAQLRDHAHSAYVRALDPTPLAGVRPGALTAAVAGCLAVGGGATYCVDQGINPIQSLAGITQPEPERPAPDPKPPAVEQAPPRTLPEPVEQAPPPEPQPAPQPQPAPEPTPPAPEPTPPAPEPTPPPVEFGEPASAPAPPPATPAPQPAPAQQGGEFGP